MLAPSRHFSVSAFTAVELIRAYKTTYNVDAVAAASALNRLDASFAAADVEAGLSLDQLLPADIDFVDTVASLRRAICFLIEHHRPHWRPYCASGRRALLEALSLSELQLFDNAALTATIPCLEALEWWYRLQALVRGLENSAKSLQGGKAEILTLMYERERLQALGIGLEPEWVGFETFGVGYDVRSYDPGPYGPVARLIEVKSSKRNPPRMILTRGEWDAAKKYGDSFVFHLWRLPKEERVEYSVAEIAAHVPDDSGQGRWSFLEIVFASTAPNETIP
ncbi:MAG: DUF3883 domain-containing protein [Hyphomonadaceae bacterium JAD_PAG50586_4]|nr:MAG: DUF3883 domain-containing protein [Hyphomonadaceae bacterium JAD_PAG50586_4]